MAFNERNPLTVSREELAVCIGQLRAACEQNPHSAPLWKSLGMAQAMNEEFAASGESMKRARELESSSVRPMSEAPLESTHKPDWTEPFASAILTYTAAISALFWLAEQL